MLARVPASRLRPPVAVLLLLLGGTGCAGFNRTFGQQEAVVQFQPQTPNAVRLHVRAACSHLRSASPEPVPAHQGAAAAYDVRYRVGGASDADLARLQQCLERFRSVVGIEFTGPGGS